MIVCSFDRGSGKTDGWPAVLHGVPPRPCGLEQASQPRYHAARNLGLQEQSVFGAAVAGRAGQGSARAFRLRLTMGPHSNGTFPATAMGPRGLIDRFDQGADSAASPPLSHRPPALRPTLFPSLIPPPPGHLCRSEYVRLLEQALRALGYEDVARQLETESGVTQQPAEASAFRAAVLRGDYDLALQVVDGRQCNAISWCSGMCSRSLDVQH